MSFTVQKNLGNSVFRFAVGRRREFRSIDHDTELSTSPTGEFVRHRPEIFYSADLRQIHKAEMPKPRSEALARTSFWTTLAEGGTKNYALLGVGALLLLLGLATIAGGKPAGVVWILGALIALAIPIVTTWTKRRSVRMAEQRKSQERIERDQRNAEMLSAYTTSLEQLREDPNDAALARVMAENEKLDLPYAVWADNAIGTVLHVGFSTLAKVGPQRAAEVAALMDRASDAAGLIAEDAKAVKQALYSTVLWHFTADDRLGEEQVKIVRQIQQGFAITPEELPIDTSSESQFERLRGVDHRNAPRCNTTVPLNLNEYCMYTAPVRIGEGAERTAIVTNKRFMIEGEKDKRIEVQVPKIDDIFVDADQHLISMRAPDLKRPLEFRGGEPIYLAAMLDLATRLDDRPKSFA
ncbi:MAG TPA: hypothetical protein VM733_01000 [Thermoanaerobaculia bacterium]|nr:hypothetical protein [Thermoanaerobaculia bacterium]